MNDDQQRESSDSFLKPEPERKRRRRSSRKRLPPVFILPNLFTSASIFCGLCSIFASSQGNFLLACQLILVSAVLDAIDGPIARLTRTASPFGLQYDSLADVVAFGIAPAFLMYHKLQTIEEATMLPPWAPSMAIGICGLFVVSGAIRLARYNIQAHGEERRHFTGLPIPAAAGVIVSTFLVIEEHISGTFLDDTRNLHRLILILMLILSYLMVSTTPFPSLKNIYIRMNQNINGLITAVFLIFGLIIFYKYLPLIFFVGFMSYLAISLIAVVRKRRKLASYSPGHHVSLPDTDEPTNSEA
mgnify:CR=1 FL=1